MPNENFRGAGRKSSDNMKLISRGH